MAMKRVLAASSLLKRCSIWRRSFSSAVPQDTIYALSSAEGKAGVAVVRISGDKAHQCLQALCPKHHHKLPAARMASFRKLHHPVSSHHLDDALVLRFPRPHSFTGEDVVELHVHGSVAVVSGVLEALSHIESCRAAEPGEFTERAFENHKMDLMQVEGLADLLNAETEAQRSQALRQLTGTVGDLYETWRQDLVRCLAHTEAMIDFADDEEDVTDEAYVRVLQKVERLRADMQSHLQDGRRGEILRNGVQVAIIGPPNAGKSSLLNLLARRPAAIVSSIPGTTRDIVQVPLNLGGYPVIVSDTAGLRETEDVIEKEGVSRAQQCAAQADIRLLMVDIQNVETLIRDYEELLAPDTLVVVNKSDLVSTETLPRSLQDRMSNVYVVSCMQKRGIDELVNALAFHVKQKLQLGGSNGAIITRERHRQHLTQCVAQLDKFVQNAEQSELAAEELRRAVDCIGRILGRVDVEDVLDVLFRDFCIGK